MAVGNRAADCTSPCRADPAGAARSEGEVRGSTKQKAEGWEQVGGSRCEICGAGGGRPHTEVWVCRKGGLETRRVAAKMSGEVHGEGWQLLVPLAAPLHTYSCLLMSVQLQMAQLRGQLWP